MSYSEVFGGQLLFPSQLSYLLITTAVDVQLSWPTEQQIGGDSVVADFLDIDATAANLNIDMPSATATSTGNKTTINNVGSNSFDVRDNDDVSIITIAPGEQWVLVLTDNTTNAGTWSTFQLGATVSVANASALAGAGIKAITTTLNQKIDSDVVNSTPFTVVDGDRARCTIYTAGAGTCNLPNAATVGDDWFFMIRNSGSGTLNIVPGSGQIDGSASLNLDQNVSCFIFTDGTDFFTIGLSSPSVIGFDFVEIAVPGSGDFVLSGANLDRIAYRFTGALTGNRRIVVPNTIQQYWVDNQTTGAFTLEIDTAAGAGQTVPQGESAIVYCDATDVINAVSSTSVTFPITIGQGGTGATTASGARTNLNAAFDGRNLTAGAGLTGGGDLTADRTFDVGQGDGIAVNANDVAFDLNALTGGAPATGDFLAFEDIDGGNANRKATISDILALGVSLPSGNVNEVIYISTAPDTYSATAAITIDPAGAVLLQENGTDVLQTLSGSEAEQRAGMGRVAVLDREGEWGGVPAVRTFRRSSNLVLTNTMTNDSQMTTSLSVGTYLIECYILVQTNGSTDDYEVTLDWTGAVNDQRGCIAYGPDSAGSTVVTGVVRSFPITSGAGVGMNFQCISSSTISSLVRVSGHLEANGAGTLSVRHRRSGTTDTVEVRIDSRMLVTSVSG